MGPAMASKLLFGCALAALAAACITRPVTSENPTTHETIVGQVREQTIDKVDLLFAIDNSASMGDKQDLLAAAVPALVNRLLDPNCVSTSIAIVHRRDGLRSARAERAVRRGGQRRKRPVRRRRRRQGRHAPVLDVPEREAGVPARPRSARRHRELVARRRRLAGRVRRFGRRRDAPGRSRTPLVAHHDRQRRRCATRRRGAAEAFSRGSPRAIRRTLAVRSRT